MQSPDLLTELFISLSPKEQSQFDSYLRQRNPNTAYLQYWKEALPKLTGNISNHLNNFLSKDHANRILAELRTFLVLHQMDLDPLRKTQALNQTLANRNAPRNQKASLNRLKKENQKNPLRDQQYYQTEYEVHLESIRHQIAHRQRNRNEIPNYKSAGNALEIAFLVSRLRLLALRRNSAQVLGAQENDGTGLLPLELESLVIKHELVPIISLLILWLQCLSNPADQQIIALSNRFWHLFPQLESDLQGDLFANLLNRMLIISNREGGRLLVPLYLFYRNGESAGVIKPGAAHPGMVKNYLTICLRINYLEEAERIISIFGADLPAHFARFSRAEMAFAYRDWKSVFHHLTILQTGHKASMKDVFFAQGVRILEIKTGYEQMIETKTARNTTFVETRTAAYISYLQNLSVLKPAIVEGSLGLAKALQRLIRAGRKSTITNLLRELLNDHSKMDQLAWLFRKVEERLDEWDG
jgi:hypothetical protein